MKARNPMILGRCFVASAALAMILPASADLKAPYAVDANTLHLWHFDEADPGPAAPASGVTGSFNLDPQSSAALEAAGFVGFGTAGDTTNNENSGFRGANAVPADLTGVDGAFTFEMMIRTSEITSIQQLMTLENGGAAGARPFQFRLRDGQLQFINIAGEGSPAGATIPTTGPEAFEANEWFHVAVTYDGNEGAADNFKYYWTRVDATRTQATELASLSMGADMAGSSSPFGVGSEYRATGGFTGNIEGQVDEVRVSNIVRDADDMLFGLPDADPPLLVGTTPADDATGVNASGPLIADFDEAMQAGTGSIEIRRSTDDSLFEAFDITSSGQILFSGSSVSITPSSPLDVGVEFYVLIPAGVVKDNSGNDYAGLTGTTDWSFTTDGVAPTSTDMGPMADATEVFARSDLSLTFDEDVSVGNGNITIHLADDDSVIQTIDVTSGAVLVAGNLVTIDLSQLPGSTQLYVNLPSGAFTDLSGNAFAGVNDTTTWAFTTAAIPEGLLYSDEFDGSTSDLDTVSPDISITGDVWVASERFNQDGSTDQLGLGTGGSATLAFTPYDGFVYTLEASFTGLSGDANWFALGFANGQSNASMRTSRFITDDVVGTAWMLFRGNASANPNRSFLGTGALGAGDNGTTDGADFPVLVDENPGGDIDLRIVLDTTGGPGAWTAAFYAKRSVDSAYLEMRAATPMLSESFNSVGVAVANDGVLGSIDSFRLYTGVLPDEGGPVLKIAQSGGMLDFEWNSLNGMQYDLVSSTEFSTPIANWAIYDDGVTTYEDIAASGTGTNMLTGVVPLGPKRFFALVEEPVPPLLSVDFEADVGGFTALNNGTGSVWAYGEPASTGDGGSVMAGAGGSTNCWGTDIGNPGFYATGTDSSLISPVIDLTSVPNALLQFAQAIDILSGDSFVVNVIDDDIGSGVTVLQAAIHTSSPDPAIDTSEWETVSGVAITGGQPVRLEWRFSGDGDGTYMGAYVDDVVVTEAP